MPNHLAFLYRIAVEGVSSSFFFGRETPNSTALNVRAIGVWTIGLESRGHERVTSLLLLNST